MHPPARSARSLPTSDRAPPAPFESLLDDSAPAPPERPAQPAADSKAADAQSKPGEPPAKAQTDKAAKPSETAKSGDAGKGETADQPAIDPKTTGGDKAAIETKVAAQIVSDDSKPASDSKPAGEPTPDSLALVPIANPAQIVTGADAIATALAPAADPAQIVTGADATATALAPAADPAKAVARTTENSAIVASATAKTNPNVPATLPADGESAADQAKLPAEAAAHVDEKPAASDADTDSIANSRGEIAAGNHRAAPADAPAATIGADANAAVPKTAADAAQPAVLAAPHTAPAPAPAANAAPAAQPAPQAAAIPLAGVAIEIASKASEGKNHFEIRLDPPELGRIEVHLGIDRDGNVTSRLIADRSDTLDLLRRDAAGLERALQDAGLKTSDNGLQFSLRDQSMGRQQDNSSRGDIAQLLVEDNTVLTTSEATASGYARLAALRGGLDIRV